MTAVGHTPNRWHLGRVAERVISVLKHIQSRSSFQHNCTFRASAGVTWVGGCPSLTAELVGGSPIVSMSSAKPDGRGREWLMRFGRARGGMIRNSFDVPRPRSGASTHRSSVVVGLAGGWRLIKPVVPLSGLVPGPARATRLGLLPRTRGDPGFWLSFRQGRSRLRRPAHAYFATVTQRPPGPGGDRFVRDELVPHEERVSDMTTRGVDSVRWDRRQRAGSGSGIERRLDASSTASRTPETSLTAEQRGYSEANARAGGEGWSGSL